MAVNDHGLEVLKKSAHEVVSGQKDEYQLRTFEGANLLSGVAYDYVAMALTTTSTSNDTEVYTFKTGGSGGTTVATITVVYASASREQLVSATRT